LRTSIAHRWRMCWFLAAVLAHLLRLNSLVLAQHSSAMAIVVAGTVHNSHGKPLPDVAMSLQENGQSTPILAKTNADGTFILFLSQPGTYVLKAQKPGWRDAIKDNLILSKGRTEVNLVLEKSSDVTSSGMEFSDQPNFTVAGVTDSSQAGGHGSDAGQRTSEALARRTVRMNRVSDRLLADDIAGRKPSGSENELRKAIAQSPGSFDANRQLGELYFLSGRFREAVPLFEAASQIKPDDYANNYDLALSYREISNYARARELVQKMLAQTDKAELHSVLGDLNERVGDPLNAVGEYEKAVRMNPSEPNYFEWGTELLLHRAVAPATEVLTKGSSLHPDSIRMLAALGAALYAAGSYEQAASRVCTASDLKPSDPDPYLFLGKMEETAPAPLSCVEEKLARFVQTQPENALAHYYYAMALVKRAKETGDVAVAQPAEGLLKEAVTIDPNLAEGYLQLGILYAGRDSYKEAIGAYQKAIDLNPQLADAHYRLGVAYQRTGHQAEAQREFQAHQQVQKSEAAAVERQRNEVQQFLIVLRDQPAAKQK